MRFLLVVGLFSAIALHPAPADGQPYVQVRARAFLDGLQASARGDTVRIEGALRDNLGAPVAGVDIEVLTDGRVLETVQTGSDGRFRSRVRLDGDGDRRIEVRWAGSRLLASARAELPITIGQNALRLRLDVPDEVPVDRPITLGAAAFDSRDIPVPGLSLDLAVDGVAARTLRTDRAGRARAELPPLPPGEHVLRLSFEGSTVHRPAEVERTIEVARPMSVRLQRAGRGPLAPGDPVVFDAQLGDARPAKARLTLTADGRPVEDVQAIDGGARFAVDPDDVPTGDVAFRVLASSETPGWRDALSDTVTVNVPPPPPPSPWWVRAPAILAAISLLAVLVRIRRRPEAAAAIPEETVVVPPPFVFEPGEPRRGDDRLEVIVQDAITGHPLAATLVHLAALTPPPVPGSSAAPPGTRVDTAADGRASFTGEGDRLWAHAAGYAPSCHALPRSQGRAVIHLLPVRARMQTLYAEVLTAAGRPPLRFGRQTPREAATPLAQRGAPDTALARFTTIVEGACFGARTPDEDDLVLALRLADDVRRGLEGAR